MKFIVVGTAGHIDHGKSSLVKHLTGTDPDRLPEEKAREITIDLGFAHMVVDSVTIGFVDVPGHERFIRNMLAGIGGVDGFLMAVSAVEGIREQTREHAEILRLLGVRRGIVAVTKTDMPDVRLGIYDECSKYFTDLLGAGITILGTSVRTGEGMDSLRSALVRLAEALPERDATGVFRLTIDRVFSLRGVGTVVTGTAVSGKVHLGEEVAVLPGERVCRVRQLQVYGGAVDEARAGQRVAMNLHGVEREELRRGQVAVAPPQSLIPTTRLIVRVEDVGLAGWPIRHGERVRVCAGSAEVLARCYLIDRKEIEPHAPPVFAELRLEEPLLVLQGDPFVLRSFSPVQTHGGGRVIDNLPLMPRRKYSAADLEQLAGTRLVPLVRMHGSDGLTAAEIVARRGVELRQGEMAEVEAAGIIVCDRKSGRLVWKQSLESLQSTLLKEIESFHAAQPLKPGLPIKELSGRVKAGEEAVEIATELLLSAGELRQAGGLLSRPKFSVQANAEETGLRTRIEEIFRAAGRRPVELSEVIATLQQKSQSVSQLIALLLNEKKLVKIATEMWLHSEGYQDLIAALRDFSQKKPRIGVAEFKALTGTTRKTAIPLLEFLDRQRLTRRDKDERIIV
ncbi:MAG: selenocysteine-specific translation elongation factor [Acidobacteria bacterium]|nr:selenocysteine-specific translation elongation factor [Acidobacteriota bacterium]